MLTYSSKTGDREGSRESREQEKLVLESWQEHHRAHTPAYRRKREGIITYEVGKLLEGKLYGRNRYILAEEISQGDEGNGLQLRSCYSWT